jgi:predicted RNA-binding protein YlqC (UPF0109 family)
MEELVKTIVKSIVNHPDSVVVEQKESVDFPGLQIIYIQVHPDDAGVVIGKGGRTINAIRNLVSISAIRQGVRVKVILKETNEAQNDSTESSTENVDDVLNDEI